MTITFTVEIRATDKTWFTADEVKKGMTADDADRLLQRLRDSGFTARARIVD